MAPVFHEYDAAPAGAHKFVELPEQKEALPLIEHGKGLFTVTTLLQTLLHPAAFVTVTEYVPPLVTDMQRDEAPVLHEYEVAPAAAQRFVEPSGQNELFPLIEHCGGLLIVTVLLHVLLHPPTPVIVTV